MAAIDFPRELHPVAYGGAHATFRRIAREVLGLPDKQAALAFEDDPAYDADRCREAAAALEKPADALHAWAAERSEC
jgi:hypothetical protein